MDKNKHVNQDINLAAFQAYIYLLQYKKYGYQDFLDLLELEKNDATYKRYVRIIKILKDALEKLNFPYILIFDHKLNKYRLYDKAIFNISNNIIVEKKFLYFRIYQLLNTRFGFNKPTLEQMYNLNKNTIIEMIRKIALVLFDANTNKIINYDKTKQTYYIEEVEDCSDEYLDYIYGKFDD